MIKLSDRLIQLRAERPDEWQMDELVRIAVDLENYNNDLIKSINSSLNIKTHTYDSAGELINDIKCLLKESIRI